MHDIDLKDQEFKRPEAAEIDAIIPTPSDAFCDDRKVLDVGSVLLDASYRRFSSRARGKDV